MKTKLLFAIILALSMAWMSSCTDKDSVTGTEAPGGTRTLSFNLTTDARVQTRAASTTPPTVADHKVQYILQVLNADGSDYGSQVTNETGTFEVELPVGIAYTCLFWAQYIPTAGGSAESAYFNTTDLKAVALKDVLTAEDQCQAFCATADVTANQAAATNTVILKRAVAQVNLRSNEDLKYYDKIEARYSGVPNTFNVEDGTVSTNGSTGVPSTFTITNTDISPDAGDNKFTFHSVYFLARGDGNANLLSIDIDTYNAGESTPIQTLNVTNVPTKKNYKTNVTATLDAASFTHNFTFDFAEWEAEELKPVKTSIWNGTVPAADSGYAFGGGDGSQGNPYIIGEAADLAQLAANVNAGTGYAGKYFQLDAHIDMDNQQWTPIGTTDSKQFEGYFNGCQLNIINFNTEIVENLGGLFGRIKNSTISNLHVNANVNLTISNYCYVGGICAYASNSSILNCSLRGSIIITLPPESSNTQEVAGIVGHTYICRIKCCANYGTITADTAGGICGYNYSNTTTACYNAGTITGTTMAGGMEAYEEPGTSESYNACYNIGTISCSTTDIGAISGKYGDMSPVTLNDCYVAVKYTSIPTKTGCGEEYVFGSGVWPANTPGTYWYADESNDGTDNKYWKSIGGWNSGGGTIVYPKLWWEE